MVVCQARGLREKEGFLDKGAFDPYVKLKINGYETKRTEAKHRSSDPTWNCKVNWEKPLYDGSLSLTCHVKHTTSLNTTEDMVIVNHMP